MTEEIRKVFFIDSDESYEEGADFYVCEDGRLRIAVTEEKAVDSYNQDFTCNVHVSRTDAIRLAHWIIREFSEPDSREIGEPNG